MLGVSSDEYLNYAVENRNEWESKGEQVVQQFLDMYEQVEVIPNRGGKYEL